MSVPIDKTRKISLFDQALPAEIDVPEGIDPTSMPFSILIKNFIDPDEADANELGIFEHVLEHENAIYESRGFVSGPIHHDFQVVDRAGHGNVFRLPGFYANQNVENERGKFVIVIDDEKVFWQLANNDDLKEHGAVIVTGCGVPRLGVRCFLKDLEVRLGLPVHLLSNNTPWGYFIYSVLKRGCLAPNSRFQFGAIDTIKHIGVWALDAERLGCADQVERMPWEDKWNEKLRCLEHYDCFDTARWQKEFANFKSQSYGVGLRELVDCVGITTVVSDVILPRAQQELG